MRAVQQTIQFRTEAVLLVASSSVQYTGLQTSYRVKQGHRCDFTSRHDKVPKTDLVCNMLIDKTLV
jgi:hypothetical protein